MRETHLHASYRIDHDEEPDDHADEHADDLPGELPPEAASVLRPMLAHLLDLALASEPLRLHLVFRGVRLRLDTSPHPSPPEEEDEPVPVRPGPARRRTARPARLTADDPRFRSPASHRCARDILEMFRRLGTRLTLTRITDELDEGLGWSHTTVSHTAPLMRQLGMLTNKRDTRGTGYGLPEWDDSGGPGDGLADV